jgi:hypothetical protein
MDSVSPEHPREVLLIAVDGSGNDYQAELMQALVEDLRTARGWSTTLPTFVNEEDDAEELEEDEEPIRTVGVFVELYSGFPPWKDRLPVGVDRAQLEDVRYLIATLAELSRAMALDLAVEYAGETIGEIVNGEPDEGVTIGLLGEWQRSLDARVAGY